jgi:hypothetical protein
MINKIGLIPLCFCGLVQAQTAMNTLEVLSFQIAREGITRIAVENDEIDDVYVYPVQFSENVKIHKTGQIFVVADQMKKPVHLTLITKRGLAQDINISPSSKTPEPIILKSADLSSQPKDETDQVNLILEKFIQGIRPSEFYIIDTEEASRSHGNVSCVVDNAYQHASLRVIVYSVKNEGEDAVSLDNKLFWGQGDFAVAFDKSIISPSESAKLYVIQKI